MRRAYIAKMIKVEFDQAKWSKLLSDYVAMGHVSAAGAVTAASRIWLRAAVRLTVPSGPGAALNKTSEQKKLGERLVDVDSRRLFQDWATMKTKMKSERLVKDVDRYLGAGLNFKAAQKAMENAGMNIAGVVSIPRKMLRAKRVNKRGHIHKKERRFVVATSGELERYIEKQKANVGFAKSGWKTAAGPLRVKLPAWVMRHNGSGVFLARKIGDRPFIEFGNSVDYANKNSRQDKVMESAGQFAQRQFAKSIAVYFNEIARGNSAKLRAKLQKDTFEAIEA